MRLIHITWRRSRHILYIMLLGVLFLNQTVDPTSQKTQKEPILINLSKTPKKRDVPLSDIAKSIHYVPLETRDDLAIGYCSAKPAGSNFIVHQEDVPLYLFDKNGSFITKIGRIGQGPGEYVNGFQNGFDNETSTFYVMDGFQQKILKYDDQGHFQESINLEHNSNEFCLLGKDRFMLYSPNTDFGDEQYGPYIMQGDSVVKWFTPPAYLTDKQAVRFSSYQLQQVDETTFICNTRYSKVVNAYQSNGEQWIFAKVDAGKFEIPDRVYLTHEFYQAEHRDYIHNVNLFATPGYVFVHYVQDGEFKMVLYNRQTKEIHTIFSQEVFAMASGNIIRQGFRNDIDGGPSLSFPYLVNNGKAYLVLHAADLLDFYDDHRFSW